ncbi:MAG: DUF192 domain-containing protein [Candidatus Omnitrophica bacterium]|nr:DUF192 domain-containing protein [Candidatus Omnitrophota bacterium]
MRVVAILLLLTGIFICRSEIAAAVEIREVCTDTKCFQSEVMSTPEGREKGLMYRASLAEDQGMLFIFDEPAEYSFWMKNMSFPIDMVWLDQDKRVVHVELGVPPCEKDPCPVYSPQSKALYVLEVAAGQADESGIQTGDQLRWN